MRVAAARAATRLGSKTKIFPPSEADENQRFPRREHIIAKGSVVVFPAPGGACKIKSLSFSKRTRKQSSMTSLIGNSDICSRTRSFSKSFTSFSHFPIGGSGVVKRLLLLLLLVERVKKLLFLLLRHVFPLAEKATLCLLKSFLISLVKRLSET
jgi:hypothetical protein